MGSREQTWKTKLVCQGVTARMTGKQRVLPGRLGSKARFSHTAALGVRENVSSHGLEN